MVPHGLVLLNKKPGLTSFQALGPIKRATGTRKVGHAGTLDKFAGGLMALLVGPYTRLVPLFAELDKEYRARFTFGLETETLDPEGEVVQRGGVPAKSVIEETLGGFRGKITQTPPVYSAVHVEGRRAYRMARAGEEVVMPSRSVEVSTFELDEYSPPEATFRIRCSKGTYVRSLARDLGRACGSAAYVSELWRTAIGTFTLDEAVDVDAFDPERDIMPAHEFIPRLPGIGVGVVRENAVARVQNGVPFEDTFLDALPPGEARIMALFSREDNLLAVVERRERDYQYRLVLAGAS